MWVTTVDHGENMVIGSSKICPWCSGYLPERANRGSPRRFCSTKCRHQFQSAERRFTQELIQRGFLTAEDLHKWASGKAHALDSEELDVEVATTLPERADSPSRPSLSPPPDLFLSPTLLWVHEIIQREISGASSTEDD